MVGVVGGGQLARMTCRAAAELGSGVRVLAAAPDASAAQVWPDGAARRIPVLEAVRDFAAGVTW